MLQNRNPSESAPFKHVFFLTFLGNRASISFVHLVSRQSGGMPGDTSDGQEASDDQPLVLVEEIALELIVTPELVLTVLTPLEAALMDWYKAQAAETLKDRLSKNDFQVWREISRFSCELSQQQIRTIYSRLPSLHSGHDRAHVQRFYNQFFHHRHQLHARRVHQDQPPVQQGARDQGGERAEFSVNFDSCGKRTGDSFQVKD